MDLKAYDSMDIRFLNDVASGRLIVRTADRKNSLRARHLIRFAGVVRRRNIGSADAVIASCCLDLALEMKKRIIFYTHDKPLFLTLQEINAFTSALTLRFLRKTRHV